MSTITLITNTIPNYNISFTGSIGYGTKAYDQPLNSPTEEACTGARYCYYEGYTKRMCHLEVRHVLRTEGVALETWFRTKLLYLKNTFSISAVTGVDFGAGVGASVSYAYLQDLKDIESLLEFIPPNLCHVNIPYFYIV